VEQLRRIREERGLSQARLAGRADLDPTTVNQVETGVRTPNFRTLEKLAKALDVHVFELLAEPAGPTENPKVPKVPAQSSPESTGEVEGERRERTVVEKLGELRPDELRVIVAATSDTYLPNLPNNLPQVAIIQFATSRLHELGLTLDEVRRALPEVNPVLAKEQEEWEARVRELKDKSRRGRAVTDEDTA
jgi:transcriptional regulator with XRE-family HTH domain